MLVGPLPSTLGQMSMLSECQRLVFPCNVNCADQSMHNSIDDLRLENNKLTGEVPTQIAENSKLRLLYLANNNLDGQIPEIFDQLHKLSEYYIGGRGPNKLLTTSRPNHHLLYFYGGSGPPTARQQFQK